MRLLIVTVVIGHGVSAEQATQACEVKPVDDDGAAYETDRDAEINSMITGLRESILANKPSNILKFASEFLARKLEVATQSAGPSPIVLAGPSGVGKGTIVAILMKRYPKLFGFSVSHTTRAPRPGEENGVHYNFVEKAEMELAIKNNEFIESACVSSHPSFSCLDNITT